MNELVNKGREADFSLKQPWLVPQLHVAFLDIKSAPWNRSLLPTPSCGKGPFLPLCHHTTMFGQWLLPPTCPTTGKRYRLPCAIRMAVVRLCVRSVCLAASPNILSKICKQWVASHTKKFKPNPCQFIWSPDLCYLLCTCFPRLKVMNQSIRAWHLKNLKI